MRFASAVFALAFLLPASSNAQQEPAGAMLPVSVLNSATTPFAIVGCMVVGPPQPANSATIQYKIRNRASVPAAERSSHKHSASMASVLSR